MRTTARQTRENRTITVDFQNEATYFRLLGDGKAFVECVLAFILSLGFQLAHKATCSGGGCLTRHSHYARVRLGGVTIWRLQCTTCKAVFTVLPHFVRRFSRRQIGSQFPPCLAAFLKEYGEFVFRFVRTFPGREPGTRQAYIGDSPAHAASSQKPG